MESDEAELILQKIGQVLAEDTEYPLDGTLLLAEVDYGYVAPSIFKELGNQTLYRRPDLDRICDPLLDLWETQETEPRWAEIEYLVRDGRFHASYIYPDEIDPEVSSLDRRDLIVRRYFGDKPITYPPMPGDDGAPQYELL